MQTESWHKMRLSVHFFMERALYHNYCYPRSQTMLSGSEESSKCQRAVMRCGVVQVTPNTISAQMSDAARHVSHPYKGQGKPNNNDLTRAPLLALSIENSCNPVIAELNLEIQHGFLNESCKQTR
jgi:hypothetical protein